MQFLEANDKTMEQVNEANADEILTAFFLSIRKEDGTKNKNTSLESVKHGVKEFLREERFIDCGEAKRFPRAAEAMTTAKQLSKKEGKGVVDWLITKNL